jgi:FkbM family methyltransferase
MGAKVDVFEPNKVNFLRACESVCVNNWVDEPCTNIGDLSVSGSKRNGRVRIFPVGIGQKEEVVKFDTGDESYNNPGQGRIVGPGSIKVSLRNAPKYQEIRLVPLDTLATQLGWYQEDIDIMKIDVEGFELDVVVGARSFLRSNRVKNIFMEGDVEMLGNRNKFMEVVRMLAASGYIVFKIGGFSGPTDTDVPPMDDNITEALTYECGHKKMGHHRKSRKKCNLWWKLPN